MGPCYHLANYSYFTHSKRHDFLLTLVYLPAHTHPHGTFHCCFHASQMKAILHSVVNAERMRDWHSFIMVKWGEKRETCQEGDVMLPSNDYVG